MNAGLLNVMVEFQKHTIEADPVGNHISRWEDWYTCHATVSNEGGSEKLAAGSIAEHADAAFTVRWCRKSAAVTPGGFRIVFGGEIYDIISVNHMNYKRKSVKFWCRKVRR